MNQKLQNILDIIQQYEKLDAEQKENLLKAVKDADKELEITAFKLERTEKVKKTTAILLEETIEELEQKRKAVEEQNRELEIETALEKVRTIAMAMRKSEDMLDVCKTISLQLESLGVKEIRNVQTAIFYEQRSTYMNYEFYSKHNKTQITETVYNNNKIHEEFAHKMLKGKGEYFITHIKGKEVKDWIAYQKTTNVFIDNYLATASSLNYYWFSLGPVALGISTYYPLTEAEINLFKRFLKVFELAYQRYLDIETAIAQAREAQIEAALERVRAASMAMHQTEDIGSVVQVYFEQLKHLEIPFAQAWITILKLEEGYFDTWFSPIDGIYDTPTHFKMPSAPFENTAIKNWRLEVPLSYLSLKTKAEVDQFLFACDEMTNSTYFSHIQEKLKIERLEFLEVRHKFGFISKTTFEPPAKADEDILMRFAKVFEQTYTRFLDIQKAEAQAREAQIELALERVRARTMAMQSSSELEEVVLNLFDGLKNLGVDPTVCNISLMDKKKCDSDVWSAHQTDNGLKTYRVFISHFEHPFRKKLVDSFLNKIPFSVHELSGKLKKSYMQHLIENVDYSKVPDEVTKSNKKLVNIEEGIVLSAAYMKYGLLIVSRNIAISKDESDILQRFAKIFEQTYTRFLDLKKAEAQTRESQIQLALERVRARTMAMHKSDELAETAAVLFQQMTELGVTPERLNICLIKEDRNILEVWSTDQEGTKINHHFNASLDEPTTGQPVYKAWIEKKKSIIIDLSGQELNDWIRYVREVMGMTIKEELVKEHRIHSVAFFSHGMILTTTPEPLPEESIHLLERFADVFNLTYRRFLDLKKAEAQAREGQIQLALEKVRMVALGLNKSEEMLQVAKALFEQLLELGFSNIRNAIIDINNEDGDTFTDYDYSHEMSGTITQMSYHDDPTLEGQFKKMADTTDDFFELKLEGKELQDLVNMRLKNGEAQDPRLLNIDLLTYNLFSFGNGAIGISNFGLLNEEEKSILNRFRNVFTFAYKRYTDLAAAEAQAREAQIELALERIRARSMAIHHSDELTDVLTVLFEQFDVLGVHSKFAHLTLFDEENDTFSFRMTGLSGQRILYEQIIDINKVEAWKAAYKQWKESESDSINCIDYPPEALPQIWEIMSEIFDVLPEDSKMRIEDFPNGLYTTQGHCKFGYLGFNHDRRATEEEKDIVVRFATEFGRVYQRFLDLKKAEAQAREAQIEAALERVRSRSMGMQKSDELKEVIKIVYQQLIQLKIKLDHAGFVVDYIPGGDWHFWIADEQDIPSKITHPYFESVWANQFNEAKEKGEDFFITNLNFEQKNKFYQELLSHIPGLPETSKDFYLSCPGLAATTVVLDNIGLYIENFSGIPYSDEENKILIRFGKVFQQTYTRFLDLQKAETQAREAQIEAALERVRSRSMAMHKSEELSETAEVLFEQFNLLGKIPDRMSIGIINEESKKVELWVTDQGGNQLSHEFFFSLDEPTSIVKIYTAWKEKKDSVIVDLTGPNLQDWLLFVKKNAKLPIDETKIKGRRVQQAAFFSQGFLLLTTHDPVADNIMHLLVRFAKVFDQTYTRFLDLKKVEAQAREAQIENALEKVRSRTMAMQKSEELSETAKVFFEQIHALGELPDRIGINIIKEDEELFEIWATNQDGSNLDHRFRATIKEPTSYSKLYAAWKAKKDYIIIDLKGQELKKWIKFVREKIKMTVDDKNIKGRRIHNATFFSNGVLLCTTHEPVKDEIIKLLVRFAKVFDQTYRRFLDLQKAEAQARESQIEAALERVRSKALAMYNTNDLSQTVSTFFNELRSLNVLPWRCGVGQINEETKTTFLTTTSNTINGESFEVKGTLQQEGHFVLDGIFEHWKMQKEYYPVLQGDDIRNYYEIIKPQIAYPVYPLDAIQYGHFIFIKEGFVFAWTENKLSEEELGIFRRFASVLSLTYRRYLDLKEAETQNKIIQAENERKTKELEEARQLQLAMLPKSIPEIPNLDIAVYMKTATEVGGDYYDFKVQENGVLNIGLGDATGHGLQAGTMITLMKGFFTSDVARFNPQKFLEHCNVMIRDIKLGRILMSFSHLRFNNNNLLISSAGMPPIYYHHKKNNRTEEIIIQGLPLGAMGSASYKLIEKQLNSGDIILLLTDGLPEQMNSHKVIFDYSRVLKYFDEIAENTPNDIINLLVQKANEWMDGTAQADDITFVVIKVK